MEEKNTVKIVTESKGEPRMIQVYRYPSQRAEKRLSSIVNRGLGIKKKDFHQVSRICEDVRKNGDRAVLEYARRFDSPRISRKRLRVSGLEYDTARKQVDRSFGRALRRARLMQLPKWLPNAICCAAHRAAREWCARSQSWCSRPRAVGRKWWASG